MLKNIEKVNILVVEDDLETLELYKELFNSTELDYLNIIFSNNGVDATRKVFNQSFDFVITDFKMPKKDGASFLKDLHKYYDKEKLETPFIFLVSGFLTKNVIQSMAILFGKRFKIFIKPFDFESLISEIKNVIKKVGKSKKIEEYS